MNFFLKYLGAFIVLLGAAMLVVYHFVSASNILLITSAALEILGIILFVVMNKKMQ